MNELEQRIHRTWVQLLVDEDCKQATAIAVDSDLHLRYIGNQRFVIDEQGTMQWFSVVEVTFHIPTSSKSLVNNDQSIKDVMEYAASEILQDRILFLEVAIDNEYEWQDVKAELIQYAYTTKLLEIEPDWQSAIKKSVVGRGIANQGNITEKAFARENKEVITYNEMKFGSRTEIRIAQEFERRKILFFPLPLAVRADTGTAYKDHREVDFLVCNDGVWGVLEVSNHDSARYEMDKEKDAWFKQSGILCVEH
jgi:hypothetical protein